MAWAWCSKSDRHTYQEALELLGFGDMDPVVFLHHLDMFHLIIEPEQTHSSAVSMKARSYRLIPDLLRQRS